MSRSVILGGEIRARDAGGRTAYEWALALASLLLALVIGFAGGDNLGTFFLAVLMGVTGVALSSPASIWGGRSPAGLLVERVYAVYRRRTGRNVFDPALATGSSKMSRDTAPVMVGDVRITEVPYSTRGTASIFRQQAGGPSYYTVVFEVQGAASGVQEEDFEDAAHIGWGQVLARCARRTSPVSHVQSFARSVPSDITDHTQWLAAYVSPDANDEVLRSYQDLCLEADARAEQHRSYVVLRFNSSVVLARMGAANGGGLEGTYRAITNEARAVMELAVTLNAITAFRPLDNSLVASLFAHCQDPYTYAIDDYEAASIDRVWQHLDGGASRHGVQVNGKGFTRVGYIPRDGFEVGELPVQALKHLVSGIYPPVIHSVSWINALQDSQQARARARRHRTRDHAKKRERAKKGMLSDGTDEVMLGASEQRAQDLMPGQGHHGAAWAAYLSYTVEREDQLESVATHLEAAASNAGVRHIEWLDRKQDLALAAVLPLGRGIRP
ncbi:SCO6880 family protein [Paeniglutamicibacter sp. NPDC012692]|uniref:SCO6880 family protein n=1 Tax=Paeniglutamicibacter sp. NPDC012692 TaxID=3364388 RepID=UPI00367C8FC5